ncbi:MAG: hypothetical protein EOO90_06465 [Pedobacter sp.]|nr:MAG: hypothetical protein EOO90_06465 [Pedobacter sp.]
MTYISAIKTTEGIVFSADSKELLAGGLFLWEDFQELVAAKSTTEKSVKKLFSAKDIHQLIQKRSQLIAGRIRSTDRGLKLFNIGDTCALAVAGKANPGGKEWPEIISLIENEVGASDEDTLTNIIETTFKIVGGLFKKDGAEKFTAETLIGGYDRTTNQFVLYRFYFAERFKLHANGDIKLDKKGKPMKERTFSKVLRDDKLSTGGWTTFVSELGNFNRLPVSINLQQGFRLAQRITELAVVIEDIQNEVPGIGGPIRYAVIVKKGFFWVSSEAEALNCLK